MRVYGHFGSICTNRVLLTFAEKAVEPEFVVVDLAKSEQALPAHLARQPFGVIPVLEDGDFSLYESRAIIRYLDDQLPGTKLTPTDVQERAKMEQWISVEYSYLSTHVSAIIREKFIVPMSGGASNEGIVDQANQEIGRTFDIIELELRRHRHLAGESFSLADVSLMPSVAMLFVAGEGELIMSRANLRAWWECVSSRASWQKVSPKRT